MKFKLISLSFLLLFFNSTIAQKKQQPPKLVIGIVVDQMRYDYLIRFQKNYSNKGFNRLLKNGFNIENAHFNYIPTHTAVGHSSIYTGTTPSMHGILGNNWYDKFAKKTIYCVNDSIYNTVGAAYGGKKSPYRLAVTTLPDQLKLANNRRGKTIGIALKDRSAILPVGHTADAAYWFLGNNDGKWISSSFYLKKLPKWVEQFNNSGKADNYLNQNWETVLPIKKYKQSIEDNNTYERKFIGEEAPVFPHELPKLRPLNGNYELLKSVPFGNSFTTDFAMAAIVNEKLGCSDQTDFLSISYSSTDYVGHRFGVDSKEIEDTYIRMDLEIERLLNFLDQKVGKNNYTLFLTADHAVSQVPNYLKSLKIPAGYFNSYEFIKYVNNLTFEKFGTRELIENFSNYQLFINRETLKKLNLELRLVENYLIDKIINFNNVYKVVSGHTLQTTYFESGILSALQKGYNQKLSGDILIVPNPSVLTEKYADHGTAHGTGYSYDTHVPIVFYGNGIRKGTSKKHYPIIDIAPTIANLLGIEFSNGNSGKIIEEVLK